MDQILSLRLEAHSDEANHHRVYVVMVGRDMFDRWSLRICYGRTGQPLCERQFGSGSEEEVRTLVRAHLRRRLSAPRRIGCAYRLRSLEMVDSEHGSMWLPVDLLPSFFQAAA